MQESNYLPYQKVVIYAAEDPDNPGNIRFALVAPEGTKDGKVKQYSMEGKLEVEETYNAGTFVGRTEY